MYFSSPPFLFPFLFPTLFPLFSLQIRRGSSSNVISVTVHIRNPPLRWDTSLRSPQKNNVWWKGKGFEVLRGKEGRRESTVMIIIFIIIIIIIIVWIIIEFIIIILIIIVITKLSNVQNRLVISGVEISGTSVLITLAQNIPSGGTIKVLDLIIINMLCLL
jgi:hypothetical protein